MTSAPLSCPQLALIYRRGEIVGAGAICGDHHDGLVPGLRCKKAVTLGSSGLTIAVLRLRLKRWLIAGLDDEALGEHKRTAHVGMGGKYLKDFAVGFSESECDRIANARPF